MFITTCWASSVCMYEEWGTSDFDLISGYQKLDDPEPVLTSGDKEIRKTPYIGEHQYKIRCLRCVSPVQSEGMRQKLVSISTMIWPN